MDGVGAGRRQVPMGLARPIRGERGGRISHEQIAAGKDETAAFSAARSTDKRMNEPSATGYVT